MTRRLTGIRIENGGTITQDGKGIWMYARTEAGIRYRKSTGTRDLDEALKVADGLSRFTNIKTEIRRSGFGMRDYEVLYKQSVKNARSRELEHSLTHAQFHQIAERCEDACELTGIKFQWIRGLGINERQPFAPSLDRIDSRLGYTYENCRIICVAANMAINTWGDWVLAEMARGLTTKHKKSGMGGLLKRRNHG